MEPNKGGLFSEPASGSYDASTTINFSDAVERVPSDEITVTCMV